MDKKTVEELKDIEALTREGNTIDAVNLSGSMMAESMAKLQQNVNNESALEEFAACGVVHVRALIAATEVTTAAATALSILFIIAQHKVDNSRCSVAELELLNNLSNAISFHIKEYEQNASEESIEHYRNILRYIVSMLYYTYNIVNQTNPTSPLLPSAYLTLKQFIDEGVPVETPQINVNGIKKSPDCPIEIYGDAIGRMNALGFRF